MKDGETMRTSKMASKPNSVGIVRRCVVVLGIALLPSCRSSPSPEPPADPSANDRQKSAVEHGKVSDHCPSARNYRVYSEDHGMGSSTTWIYFEAPESELIKLLNIRQNLPNADDLGDNPIARYSIEELLQRNGRDIPWWRPEILTDKRYASKEIPFDTLGVFGLQYDVCIGRIDDHWCGFYMVCSNMM